MKDRPDTELSRRSILKRAAITAGGAALAAGVAGMSGAARAETVKMKQSDVAYQDKPHDGQQCDTCVQFEPPSSCKVVEGTISPKGWCQLWVKKA